MRLGGARADFVGSLGRKVADLRGLVARARAQAGEIEPRDELRRKLGALASGARMMKFDAMDRAIAEALGRLDRAPLDVALEEADLEAIEQTLEDLPALAWGERDARSSGVAKAAPPKEPTYGALVVGSPLMAEALLEEVGEERPTFACECTPDAQAAFDLARASEPDLVVVDADLAYVAELVDALMDEPVTEGAAIVVVGSFLEPGEAARYVAMGVAKTLPKPTSRDTLRRACEEALAPPVDSPALASLGEPTLAELGERLADELRQALVGKVDPLARARRVPLGEGTEVLSALWGAIARVREVVTARTGGDVRFAAGPEGALTMAPPLLDLEVACSDRARTRLRGPAAEVRLQGRRVVVADDDPAVVWFMADLLKSAGCVVHEAFDGKQALETAYRTSPDLVISDILMPNLDGFSLCRALRRDVALRDVPVILLSWKEDLLQRVRELGAGAAGYVRKESDTKAILARVREAVRPRARVEARLRDDGEVRGRLDGVSVRTLLEIVCATRPEARVSVRDASFLYEVEVRWGAPQRATRIATDGSVLKGSRVLAAMLGASAGRFTVATSKAPVEAELDGNLAAQLAKPIARARAATALLTGPELMAATRVQLDPAALADYLRATPAHARAIAEALASGTAPRALVLDGTCDASLLEDLAVDLAARGVVTGVASRGEDDLLGPEAERLFAQSDARAALAPKTATPSPVPAEDEAESAFMGLAEAGEEPEQTADACAADLEAPLCDSPIPAEARAPDSAASLEDAVMREVAHRSPEPSGVKLPEEPSAMLDPKDLKPRTSPPPPDAVEDDSTLVDTCYAEREESIPIDEVSSPLDEDEDDEDEDDDDDDEDDEVDEDDESIEEEGADEVDEPSAATPFATVQADTPAGLPKRRTWPMVAFVAATAVVAWAVLRAGEPAPKHVETAPPPAAEAVPAPEPSSEGVMYTDVAAGAELPPGNGVLDVTAPSDAVVVVDGAERGRGGATLPLWAGTHDVRIDGPDGERTRAVVVRAGKIARVSF